MNSNISTDESLDKEVAVIVLMAGEGKRMRPLTKDRPKALLCVPDGKSIFTHIAESFAKTELNPIMIPVVGHGVDKVDEEMEKLQEFIRFQKVYNPFYKTTGPLISVWLGLLASKENCVIVTNGDTMLREELTEEVNRWLQQQQDDRPALGLCVSKSAAATKDDMKVKTTDENGFLEVGKHIVPDSKTLKSAGVFIVNGKEVQQALAEKIDGILKTEEGFKTSYHWHNLVNEMSKDFKVDLIEVDSNSWCEMDTLEEFRVMEEQS